ncbi:MAG: hypothetical protein ACK4MM_00990 [Fervidobacterium sp.]
MNTFEKDGFRFDGGARAIVNSGLFSPMVKEFELDLELIQNPITLIIEDKKLFINGLDSIDVYSEILKELYPNNHTDVDKIIDVMRSIIEDMKVLYGVNNPLFSKNKKKIILAIPSIFLWIIKLMGILHKMDKMKIPVEEFLDSLTNNRSLKDIISQHFFKGTPTFFALSYFALYNDYLYPKGGVGTFPKKLAEKSVKPLSDKDLKDIILKVLKENNKAVEEYKAGKEKAIEFIIGQVLTKTKKQADPKTIRKIILASLK